MLLLSSFTLSLGTKSAILPRVTAVSLFCCILLLPPHVLSLVVPVVLALLEPLLFIFSMTDNRMCVRLLASSSAALCRIRTREL